MALSFPVSAGYRVQETKAFSRFLTLFVDFMPAPTDVAAIKGVDAKDEEKRDRA